MGVPLSDADVAFLIATIATDLDATHLFPGTDFSSVPPYFQVQPTSGAHPIDLPISESLTKLFAGVQDADTYFSCLATLHKRRMKYDQILRRQPFPTFEQVGPRGLLQYGTLTPKGLLALLFWRKWIYDLDNRAAQDTGYIFEPILASAIGGAPMPAGRSPVKRRDKPKKGRQVDCLLDKKAYEFKIRVTIAASGQGRWGEELDFPEDCEASGYTPVLVVLDPTENPKLTELAGRFEKAGGECFIGDDAWTHLEQEAGDTMGVFLDKYVKHPLDSLVEEADTPIGDLHLEKSDGQVKFTLGGEQLTVDRGEEADTDGDGDLPDDVDADLPGL